MAAVSGRSVRRWVTAVALGACLAAALMGAACGTSATGVTACKQIEEARCRRAPACNVPLEPPYSTSGTDVDACIRFYDVACLHGLQVSDPGPVVVSQCVDAINNGECSVVVAPQKSAACAWLVPSPEATDASDAPDASEDASETGE